MSPASASVIVARNTFSTGGGGGGSLVDGQNVTITGTGFGTNASVVQAFFGGVNGPIEAASNGTNIVSGVTLPSGFAIAGGDPQFVVTSRALNGTKSILNRVGYNVATGGTYVDPTSGGPSIYGISYDPGAAFFRMCSVVCSYKTGFTNGQIKFQRATGNIALNSGLTDDCYPNILLNCYHGGIGSACQTNDNAPTGFSEPNIDLATDPSWVDDGWVQQYYDFTPGTINTANGTLGWRFVNATNVSTVLGSGTGSSKRFWRGSDPAYRYWLMQFYLANTAQVDGAQVNIDRDAYAVFNTANANFPKFVFLGNASTYAACTKLVAGQVFSSWSDTSITFAINKGQQTSLTSVWAYVMSGVNTAINSAGIVPV